MPPRAYPELMGELDALLAQQVAYYRARAPEYLEDAGVEGVTPETQSAAAQAIEAALDAAAPLGDVLELACGRQRSLASFPTVPQRSLDWTRRPRCWRSLLLALRRA